VILLDPHDHERTQHERWLAVSTRMLELEPIQESLKTRCIFTLTCPRGHKLFPAYLDRPRLDERLLFVVPINDYGRATSAPTAPDALSGGRARSPCLEAGCPVLVRPAGRCPEHGGRPALNINPLGTRFTCRLASCEWPGDRITMARLLQIVTTALVAGSATVPIAGQGVSRRSRKR
jgi:hypothetical protein